MEPHLRHPMLVIKLIVMPCDKRKPGNTKIRVQIARNVSKNGVKTKRAALLHRDIYAFAAAAAAFHFPSLICFCRSKVDQNGFSNAASAVF